MKRLPFKAPAERIVVTFDFARRLSEGASLTSPVVTASVASGTDASPGAVISGAASVVGTKVLQLVVGGLDAVDYRLDCQVDAGAERFVLPVRLPVRAE